MKIRDILLLEYRRDVTLKNLQPRLDSSAAREDLSGEQALDALERMDPTRNQQYVPWLARQYSNQTFRTEDSPRILSLLQNYHGIKQRLPQEQRDINRFTLHQLEDLVDRIMHGESTEVAVSREIPPDTRVLYNGPLGTLAVPETQAASCALGSGTRWCTAARENNMFAYYHKHGPLYIWIDRDGSKYQFHFETKQFMDAQDRRLDGNKMDYFIYENPITKKLFKMKADDAATDPALALNWALGILRGKPFPDGEPEIMKSPKIAVQYAQNCIQGPWPAGEHAIAKSAESSLHYATNVLYGRFLAGEDAIASDGNSAFEYSLKVLHAPFPKGEDAIAKNGTMSLMYALHVLNGRFEKGEPEIAKSSELSFTYAQRLNFRFQAGERLIARSKKYAFYYAVHVIKGPWPAGEATIARIPRLAYNYATTILKGRFPQAERYMKIHYPNTYKKYCEFLHSIGTSINENP